MGGRRGFRLLVMPLTRVGTSGSGTFGIKRLSYILAYDSVKYHSIIALILFFDA